MPERPGGVSDEPEAVRSEPSPRASNVRPTDREDNRSRRKLIWFSQAGADASFTQDNPSGSHYTLTTMAQVRYGFTAMPGAYLLTMQRTGGRWLVQVAVPAR